MVEQTLEQISQEISSLDSVEIVNYVILHTRSVDFLLMFLGWIGFVLHKYLDDKSLLEKKIKLAKLDQTIFINTFYPEHLNNKELSDKFCNYFKIAKWEWKVWWNDNDEKFYSSLIFSILLIISLPETWYRIDTLNSIVEYNSIISVAIGYAGSQIGKTIITKIKNKNV